MRILVTSLLLFITSPEMLSRSNWPDLSSKEDLKALGIGRIVERDHSILKDISLAEMKEYWIVYVKDGSVHDMLMDNIDRIEFKQTKWGPLKIEFIQGKTRVSGLT